VGNNCTQTILTTQNQVRNPIISFAGDPTNNNVADNNGVIIKLPAVGSSYLSQLNGNMIFGIGTRSNNSNPPTNIFLGNPNSQNGTILTQYSNNSYNSIFDTGSTTIQFNDNNISTSVTPSGTGFYYDPLPNQLSLNAVISSYNSTTSESVSFNIINYDELFANNSSGIGVIPGLAASTTDNSSFIWGIPFFYGKNIYVGISNQTANFDESTTAVELTGPFFAY
jgi:hypothetical protein